MIPEAPKNTRALVCSVCMAFILASSVLADTDSKTEIVEWERVERQFYDHELFLILEVGIDENRLPVKLVFTYENRTNETFRLAE